MIAGRVNDLAWDADSKRIIAVGAGKERYGHCFTADTGNTVGEISGHSAPISSVAIRPVRPYTAVTVGDDGALVCLSTPPFKFKQSVRNQHNGFIRGVAYSPDGAHIASVGSDRKVVIYDKDGSPVHSWAAHEGGVLGVAWASNLELVTCLADASVKTWLADGQELNKWALPKTVSNQLLGVVVADDVYITVSLSGDLYFFEEGSSEPSHVIRGHQKAVTAISVSGTTVYLGSYDGRICAWPNLADREIKPKYIGDKEHLVASLESANSTLIATSWDDTANAFGSETWSVGLGAQPKAVSSVTKSGLFAVALADDVVSVLSKDGKKVIQKKFSYEPAAIDMTDSIVVVSDARSFETHFYAASSLEPIQGHTLKSIAKPASARISSDGAFLAVGDSSGKIVLYDIENRKVKTSRWVFHTARVTSISWRSDSKYAVSGSVDGSVIVYSVERPMSNLRASGAHKEGVNGVAWMGNDSVVSVGGDATVKVWSVKI